MELTTTKPIDNDLLGAYRMAERMRLLRKFYKLLYAAYSKQGEDKFERMLKYAAGWSENTSSERELQRVSKFIGIPVEVLQKKTRKREIVEARQVAMFLSKKYTKESLAVIGMKIGGKDHATVLHACRTVDNLIQTCPDFRSKWNDLDECLRYKTN